MTPPDEARRRWHSLFHQAPAADSLFDLLHALYASPPRAYHNIEHVLACLRVLDEHRSLAKDESAAALALWLHDCVYEPGRSDNESRSAAVASIFTRELGWEAPRSTVVRALIMATRHAGDPLDGDEALIADIDMSILAAPPDDYARYAAAIRAEYAFVPDPDYRKGRAEFLRRLLTRGRIFQTAALWTHCQTNAVANIKDELRALDGG